MKNLVSIIIPARKERYLNNTIADIQKNAKGKYEIIVILDGYWTPQLPGVTYIYNRVSRGMRTAINQGVEVANGEFLMKLDAHCRLDKGFDKKLLREHRGNWVQIPRRKRLDAETWSTFDSKRRPDIDYMRNNSDLIGLISRSKNNNQELKKKLIDDTESFQGSCYFITKEYFNKLGLLDDKNFAGSGHEAQEIAIKVWADGGRVIRNKKTWYAHARLARNFSSDRTKSREYIKVLAKDYGYKKD